jgi:hypothetical protein
MITAMSCMRIVLDDDSVLSALCLCRSSSEAFYVLYASVPSLTITPS